MAKTLEACSGSPKAIGASTGGHVKLGITAVTAQTSSYKCSSLCVSAVSYTHLSGLSIPVVLLSSLVAMDALAV